MKKPGVLLLKLDAIGDYVLFTPVLPHLRKLYPDSVITLAVHPDVGELAEDCRWIDKVLLIDQARFGSDAGYSDKISRKVRRKFGVVINCMYTRTWQSDNIAARTHAPVRIGFECLDQDGNADRRRREQVLYTALVPAGAEWKYEAERYRELLLILGCPVPEDFFKPEIKVRSGDRKKVLRLLEGSASKPYVVISPGSGFLEKSWNPVYFAEICDWLIRQMDYRVIVTGTKNDRSVTGKIVPAARDHLLDLTGVLSLREYIALIAGSALFVGVDTAGFHIAWCLGIPTVGIFGGGHFGRFNPPGLDHVRIVYNPLDCYHCYWRCRYDTIRCLESIPAESVTAAIRSLDLNSGKKK